MILIEILLGNRTGSASSSLLTICVNELLKCADLRGQERARKLGRASSRGPEAPIVVYNDRARCMYRTRLSLTGIATPVDKRAPRHSHRCSNKPAVRRAFSLLLL
ncbi:hypothetical protein IEO21_08418 [Rhodonia placenta]|uniref:Uncharacterized protein n=1 Tax=Rhodonia placenta TaxID=104341 RepID=A0A8H7NW61_9APHY|nr:hypothetical protein IEO21_08418 [Postia placenta]